MAGAGEPTAAHPTQLHRIRVVAASKSSRSRGACAGIKPPNPKPAVVDVQVAAAAPADNSKRKAAAAFGADEDHRRLGVLKVAKEDAKGADHTPSRHKESGESWIAACELAYRYLTVQRQVDEEDVGPFLRSLHAPTASPLIDVVNPTQAADWLMRSASSRHVLLAAL